jgi:hypothetical protein
LRTNLDLCRLHNHCCRWKTKEVSKLKEKRQTEERLEPRGRTHVPANPPPVQQPIAAALGAAYAAGADDHSDDDDIFGYNASASGRVPGRRVAGAQPMASTSDMVNNELAKYLDYQVPLSEVFALKEPKNLLPWWEKKETVFPFMALLGRSIHPIPSTSGGLELDFGGASRVLTSKRGSLSPAYVEMITSLAHAMECIPDSVPIIKACDLEASIPARLTNPGVAAELDIGDDDEEEEVLPDIAV